MQLDKQEAIPDGHRLRSREKPRMRLVRACGVVAGLAVLFNTTSAHAQYQYPQPHIPELSERSGLVMRYVGTPERLPHDPLRDNFYNLRFANRGLVKHPDGIKDQGLYGLGWKSDCTESVYPFFMGSPGTNKVNRSCLPWPRSLRFLQSNTNFLRPVGMYYVMGSYVPIYDFDPWAPGPGPYPYPFYFNWGKGG